MIFDVRRTSVEGDAIRLGGLRLGLEYKRVNRFGIGVYGLDNQIVREITSEAGAIDTIAYNFGYTTLFYERILWFHPKWEWSAAVHFGSGTIQSNRLNLDPEDPAKFEEIQVRPFELSTSTYYNLTWWLSIGGGAGYRVMRKTPTDVRDAYNGFIYIAKVKFRLLKIIKSKFNEDVKDEY